MIILMSKVVSTYKQRTCMRLTNTEWNILQTICLQEKITRKQLLEHIKQQHSPELNFTSAVRLFTQIYLYKYWQTANLPHRHTSDILRKSISELM